jgi:hypothetical protein
MPVAVACAAETPKKPELAMSRDMSPASFGPPPRRSTRQSPLTQRMSINAYPGNPFVRISFSLAIAQSSRGKSRRRCSYFSYPGSAMSAPSAAAGAVAGPAALLWIGAGRPSPGGSGFGACLPLMHPAKAVPSTKSPRRVMKLVSALAATLRLLRKRLRLASISTCAFERSDGSIRCGKLISRPGPVNIAFDNLTQLGVGSVSCPVPPLLDLFWRVVTRRAAQAAR